MISMNKEYHLGTLRKGLNAVKEARGWGVGGEEGRRAQTSTNSRKDVRVVVMHASSVPGNCSFYL